MRISDEHRFLFVHVQKTGGVTMEKVLDENIGGLRWHKGDDRHKTLGQILKMEPELAQYWVFGVVRNPWARMLSWYSMLKWAKERAEQGEKAPQRMMSRIAFWREASEYPDFDTFLERGPKEHGRLRRPQIKYLQSQTRRADFIGRTENLEADIRAIFARLGLEAPPEVPHKNKSPAGGATYREHYSANGRDRVAKLFEADIEAFGYEY